MTKAAINIAVRRLSRHPPPGSIFPSPATSTRIVLMGDAMRTRLVVVVFVALIPALCFSSFSVSSSYYCVTAFNDLCATRCTGNLKCIKCDDFLIRNILSTAVELCTDT